MDSPSPVTNSAKDLKQSQIPYCQPKSVANSERRAELKQKLYQKLYERIKRFANIVMSATEMHNLVEKIEADVFRITSGWNSKLDYETYMTYVEENVTDRFEDGYFLKIFRGKIGMGDEMHKKFIDLTRRQTPSLTAEFTRAKEPTRLNVLEEPSYWIKCFFCNVEINGTNALYQKHLLANHMKSAEIKLKRLTSPALNSSTKLVKSRTFFEERDYRRRSDRIRH